MTRDIDWGIPIPLDGWREQPTKRLYVWFDAVIGYLSASIEWARRAAEPERWRDWWNDPEALSYYFMGKDNITFHSQIWPAELLAYDGKGERGGAPGEYGLLELPTEVVSSEFMTMESKQFSTSRGHVILVGDMLARYQPDALRYFICAAGPETSDSDFTWAEFVQRTNSELVAGWGNLVNRTATMIAKNFGEIPPAGTLEPVDQTVLDTVACGFGDRRRPDRPAPPAGRDRRGDAGRRRGEQVPHRHRALQDEGRRPARAPRHRAARRRAVRARLQHAARAVPAALLQPGVGGVRRQGRVHADAADRARRGPRPRRRRRAGRLPDHHRRVLRDPAWERRPVVVGTPVAKPSPIFTKLDPSVVDEERARLAGE